MQKQIHERSVTLSSDFERLFTEKVHSVSEINGYVKEIISSVPVFGNLKVRGEISNCVRHTKGHIYFSLKDEKSVIKAVIFAGSASNLKIKPENGMKVVAAGRLTVYEAGGVYQIVVSELEADGVGALYEAYERLKKKLESEGLFSDIYKKKLPGYPTKIGVITSPTGAAVRDIIKTAESRWPLAEIILYPAIVQGIEAEASLVRGVRYFGQSEKAEVVIIGRGGGSIEDLWAFNSEILAREIVRYRIPFVSAVGHETDFTICDFVCSVRAATPTGAAVLVTPQKADILNRIDNWYGAATKAVGNKIADLNKRLENCMKKKVMLSPLDMIEEKRKPVELVRKALMTAVDRKLKDCGAELSALSGKLESLSPLSVLSRGYGAVFDGEGKVITKVSETFKGKEITVKMSDGEFGATVTDIWPDAKTVVTEN